MKPASTVLVAFLSANLLAGCGGHNNALTPAGGPLETSLRTQSALASSLVREATATEKMLHSLEGGATDGSTPISGLLKVGDLL
jgi:hypothetical protein